MQFSIECQKEFGIELVWFSFAPLLIEKMWVILRTNQMKIWYQPRHLLLRFPAPRVGFMSRWVVIGSLLFSAFVIGSCDVVGSGF